MLQVELRATRLLCGADPLAFVSSTLDNCLGEELVLQRDILSRLSLHDLGDEGVLFSLVGARQTVIMAPLPMLGLRLARMEDSCPWPVEVLRLAKFIHSIKT